MKIAIEVAYARPERQLIIPLKVAVPCTVAQAVRLSGILPQFAELEENTLQVGIFSRRVSLTQELAEGDRVEIYRPLQIDPKQARRVRAKRIS